MFFSSGPRERLEPVGEVGYSFAFCPLAKARGDLVGNGAIYLFAAPDGSGKAFVGLIAQEFPGNFQGKNILAKNGGDLRRALNLLIAIGRGAQVINSFKT